MSYLNPPQITFMGNSYSNPSTANNNDYASVFNVDTLQINPTINPIPGSTVVAPPGAPQTFNFGGPQDADALRSWLMGLLNGIAPGDGGPYGQQAHWNYYGDHATRFDSATVTGIVPANGITIPANDPLRGATVQIFGNKFFGKTGWPVIVDVDPYALITSQIFTAELRITAADGTVLVSASPASRALSYFINVFKNVDPNAIGFEAVSAVFFFSIPNGTGLQINPNNVTSPALTNLAQAAAAGQGLNIRYCFYDAIYANSPQTMAGDFAKGAYTMNPYLGKVLGTIGVLNNGDMQSAPQGRKLYVQNMYSYTLGPDCGQPPAAPPKVVPPLRYSVRTGLTTTVAKPSMAALGVTTIEVNAAGRTVSLDLINTFPECNVKTNTKLVLGPMELDLLFGANPQQRVTIGSIAYDQKTYESAGGMYQISWANNPKGALIDQNIASGTLAIHSVSLNQDLLLEVPGIDIQTDTRAVYFQEQGNSTVTIQAFQKGAPVTAATKVNLEYWMCDKTEVNPSKPMVPVTQRYFSVGGATALPNTIYTQNGNQISVITDQVTIPANGTLTLNLAALQPGVSVVRFVDPAAPLTAPNFAWDNVYYAIVRILPLDDFSGYTDAQINDWQFMYENVFCYFSLLYPIMSHVMPWGPDNAPNNPDQVRTFATQITSLTDPALWNSTIYMPITRELSAGKRALLVRWCNLQQLQGVGG